ncbi:TRAP transporter small permease [Rhodocyclaceae bacterium SMB388]
MSPDAIPSSRGTILRLGDRVVGLGRVIAELCLLAMVILIAVDVVLRNVANRSLLITDEVSGYLLVAIVFFGAAHSLRSGAFLRIAFLFEAMPKRARAVMAVVFDAAAVVLTVLLLYQLGRFTWRNWEFETVATTLLETPLWIPQSVMVLGCAVFLVAVLLELTDSVIGLRHPGLPQRSRATHESELHE